MIGIVDYGLGNISAFANIYKQLNIPFKPVKIAEDFTAVSKLILPGVGAFDYAMQLLNESGMRDKLDDMVLNQKVPVLGVCVGMQMMADSSEEGVMPGLGWVSGSVCKIDVAKLTHKPTIPHMGWNQVRQDKDHPLWAGIPDLTPFYFVHSFYAVPANANHTIGSTEYGAWFTSAIARDSIFATQFHPEKSGDAGLHLIKNWVSGL